MGPPKTPSIWPTPESPRTRPLLTSSTPKSLTRKTLEIPLPLTEIPLKLTSMRRLRDGLESRLLTRLMLLRSCTNLMLSTDALASSPLSTCLTICSLELIGDQNLDGSSICHHIR